MTSVPSISRLLIRAWAPVSFIVVLPVRSCVGWSVRNMKRPSPRRGAERTRAVRRRALGDDYEQERCAASRAILAAGAGAAQAIHVPTPSRPPRRSQSERRRDHAWVRTSGSASPKPTAPRLGRRAPHVARDDRRRDRLRRARDVRGRRARRGAFPDLPGWRALVERGVAGRPRHPARCSSSPAEPSAGRSSRAPSSARRSASCTADARRREFESRLSRALEMSDDETHAYDVVGRAMRSRGPRRARSSCCSPTTATRTSSAWSWSSPT